MRRISVREALFRLVETGVIRKEYWKGYFIREITDEMILEIVEVRIALESCAIRNFVKEASQEALDKLFLSPHVAGITTANFRRGHRRIWKAYEDVTQGRRPANIVNGL